MAGTRGATGDHQTRRRVARMLLENGALSAAELADRLDVTPTAIRRHLDALVSEGALEPRERRVRGRRGRGRPAKVFVITDAGRAAFDQAYDDLAVAALRFVESRGGGQAVREFAHARVSGLKGHLEAQLGEAPESERARILAEALSDQGYAASVTPVGNGGSQLCQHHCPVSQVAEEFPVLCEAETELFSELLGTHVQRLATIAHGDGVCTTYVPGPSVVTSDDAERQLRRQQSQRQQSQGQQERQQERQIESVSTVRRASV